MEATATGAMGPRMFAGDLVYNNKMWIIAGGALCTLQGGVKSDVWSSTDGKTWTQVTANAAFGERWAMGRVVFNNKMWVIGGETTAGYQSDVWTSTDGGTWTQVLAAAPFAGRQNFGCVVFNNKIWVICGDDLGGMDPMGDVWSSPDGINWTKQGTFPSPRTGAACVVFNGAIWYIAGGYTEPDPADGADAYMVYSDHDAWYSYDGINWTQATANTGFTPRVYPSAQVYNNQIWLLGGAGSSLMETIPETGVSDDVWVSNNGTNWTQTYPSLPFAARFAAQSYVFNNKFFVVGGCDFVPGGASYYSDAWHNP